MAAAVMKNRDFYSSATPQEIRKACREGSFTFPTCGFAPGKVQANLVVLPQGESCDALCLCQQLQLTTKTFSLMIRICI